MRDFPLTPRPYGERGARRSGRGEGEISGRGTGKGWRVFDGVRGLNLHQRQRDAEDAARADFRLNGDCAIVLLGQMFGDEQAQAEASLG